MAERLCAHCGNPFEPTETAILLDRGQPQESAAGLNAPDGSVVYHRGCWQILRARALLDELDERGRRDPS